MICGISVAAAQTVGLIDKQQLQRSVARRFVGAICVSIGLALGTIGAVV